MRRRDFITLVGGAAAWPLAARAQQSDRMRRIGVLMNSTPNDPLGQARFTTFEQALQELGWSDGRNVSINIRWGGNDVDLDRRYAAELVEHAPDVILAAGTLSVAALQHVTRTLPIVFVSVADPVGAGIVDSLAKPGGNTTGFMLFEYNLSGKWLELLKQIAPAVTHVVVLRDPANPAGSAQFGALQAVAPSMGIELRPVDSRDVSGIERAFKVLAMSSNGGVVGAPSASESPHRDLIIALAAQYKLPAVYSFANMVSAGGLISYGPDRVAQFRSGAGYVDRILKGEKPGDLPVQAPTKYELLINLKTAKAIGLTIPQSLLTRADEVIE